MKTAVFGFEIRDALHEHRLGGLYRAFGSEDGQSVIVKTLNAKEAPADVVARFRNEFVLLERIDHPGVARALWLREERGQLEMGLGDEGGSPLDAVLMRGPMSVDDFLRVAIDLAVTLGALHKRRIAHRGISPASILWNPETGRVQLMAFERAEVSSRPGRAVAGVMSDAALPYLSPEQTGRMNRLLDHRADFYSLGVTFYQMLSGTLPFQARDALEWVHCHIARSPRPLAEAAPALPPGLSRVVMKLLAKPAEDRYQTALGLESDLKRCLVEWTTTRSIPPFSLGDDDIADQLLMPQRLYGRETESAALRGELDAAIERGVPALILIAGYSGVGKSSLVRELSEPACAAQSLFISGKFVELQRNIPYSTLAEAFHAFVRQLLVESEERTAEWRERIQRAVGINGRVIIDVLPDVALLIGPQPPVPELPPAESQNRFDMVFSRFLGAFAKRGHPLVLFLDDLQWIDAASLRLLERVLADPETRDLLIVGAYRDNEVTEAHPLMLALGRIRQGPVAGRTLSLSPLSLDAVHHLVADVAHSDLVRVEPLGQLVYEKTGGNPFFLIQFLTTLYDEGLLEFDSDKRRWRWDLGGIRAKGYTDNVIEFLVRRLQKLPASAIDTLKSAACIGNRFDRRTLAAIRDVSESEVQRDLDLSVQERLLLVLSENVHAFVHDRVQQAAYSLLGPLEKQRAHLRIGRALQSSFPADELHEHLFEIAEQLDAGLEGITDEAEKRQAAAINLRASQRAIQSTAYASARQFARAAWSLLQQADWGSDYEQLRQLYDTLARTEYLNGDLDRCRELIAEALPRLRTNLEKAELHNLLIIGQTLEGAYEGAIESGRVGLALLGVELPARGVEAAVRREVEEIDELMGRRHPSELLAAPLLSDPVQRMAQRILLNVDVPAYIGVPSLFPLIVAKMVKLSLRYGNSLEACKSFANYGVLIGRMFQEYGRGHEFARLGWDLLERLRAIAIKCKTCIPVAGLTQPWVRPLRESLPVFEDGLHAGMATGDLQFVGYSLFTRAHVLYVAGDPLPTMQATIETALTHAARSKNQWAADSLHSLRYAVMDLLEGKLQAAPSEEEAAFVAECRQRGNGSSLCIYHCYRAQRLYHGGEYHDALEQAAEAKRLTEYLMGSIAQADATFYHALAVIGVLGERRPARETLEEELDRDRAMLRIWHDSSPANFAHKYLLVEAEAARLRGSVRQAMDSYEAAIQCAGENGFVQDRGLALELAARLYREQGWERIAEASLGEARASYSRWGSQSKVRQLEGTRSAGTTTDRPAAQGRTDSEDTLDAIGIIQASQAISREIELSRVVQTVMGTVVKSAGAEIGILLLVRGQSLEVESIARVVGQSIEAARPPSAPLPTLLPLSILNYVRRTHETVILEDASRQHAYATDAYVMKNRPASVLCLPLLRQAGLVGMLYLENNLVRGAFNADRTAVLQLLASQAAISLENARNYEALREREAQIRELVETSPIAIAIQGPQEEIELVNRKFTEVFGYTRADIPNVEAWWPRAYPDEQEREAVKREWWRRTDEAARSQGEIVPLEAKVRCKDGGERYVEFRAASVGDRTFVVLSDLTERQQAEQERERLVEASRAASRAKDQLLAVLSHELRNPLAAIRAGTDLLRQTLLSEEPSAKHAITVIERNARLQARLVDDLLDLSRVSRGQLELMRAPVQLDSLVSMAVQTFRADAARKHVAVEVKAAPDLWVDADLDRLQQVVTNLLGNALKFTPAHGRVCVSVERAGDRGRIVVEDTGIGIEPNRLSRLFETFGDGERRPGTGLGIGLALVKSLTELHQGQVRAESAGVGRGSRFEVLLPLIEAPEGWAAVQAEERGRGPTRLLLVEDNADTRLMLVEALRMRGYQVLSAETGEAALEILGREQVDVILSDIGLPGMDGYEFLGRARAIPTVARTPALAVTGYGQERDARLARDAGFAEHLVKPVDLRSLDEHIRRSLAAPQG